MFEHGFPPYWSTIKKLIWLVGTGIVGGVTEIWKTVTGTLLHITNALASPMQKCEVSLEPIQDLHGQDAPYPAGGGKNKINIDATEQAPSDTTGSNATKRIFTENTFCVGLAYSNYYYPNNVSAHSVANGTLTVTNSNVYGIGFPLKLTAGETYFLSATTSTGRADIAFYQSDGTWISGENNKIGSTITVPNNADTTVLIFYAHNNGTATFSSIQLELGNQATTFAPYSNICPITGWTGCEVNVSGVNVWDEEWEVGSFDSNGQPISASTTIRAKNYISVVPNKSYRVINNGTDVYLTLVFYDIGNNIVDVKSGSASAIHNNSIFTVPANALYMKFSLPTYGAVYGNNVSINYPSTDTSYHAYSGTTLSVTFPDSTGTVYGGTVDLVSGVLVADKVVITDFANLYIAYNIETGIIRSFYVRIPDNIPRKADTFVQSNIFKSQPLAGTHAYDCEVTTSSGLVNRIYFSISNVDYPGMTAVQAQQFLIDNNVQFLINLATPIEIQLTPQEISTLAGENNIWGDGTITAIYKATE